MGRCRRAEQVSTSSKLKFQLLAIESARFRICLQDRSNFLGLIGSVRLSIWPWGQERDTLLRFKSRVCGHLRAPSLKVWRSALLITLGISIEINHPADYVW